MGSHTVESSRYVDAKSGGRILDKKVRAENKPGAKAKHKQTKEMLTNGVVVGINALAPNIVKSFPYICGQGRGDSKILAADGHTN